MLPISYPGLITAISFAFLFAWNDLIYAMTFVNIAEMRPLTAGIYHFMDLYGTEWNKQWLTQCFCNSCYYHLYISTEVYSKWINKWFNKGLRIDYQ